MGKKCWLQLPQSQDTGSLASHHYYHRFFLGLECNFINNFWSRVFKLCHSHKDLCQQPTSGSNFDNPDRSPLCRPWTSHSTLQGNSLYRTTFSLGLPAYEFLTSVSAAIDCLTTYTNRFLSGIYYATFPTTTNWFRDIASHYH